MSLFVIFKFPASSVPRTSRRCRGRKPRRQMPASAGGHCRGHCRGDIAGALHGKPECSSGLPLVVLKLYPELHSGIL
ncbi:unnamed protein product, partial [Staurois parvus]